MRIFINSNIKKNLFAVNRLAKKRLVKVAKLSFNPEQAKIGPALAQLGINSMEFCERFNFQTRGFDKELNVCVKLNVFSDKSFSFSWQSFNLRDLVLSFDLDLIWLSVILKILKNEKSEFLFPDEFFLLVYKSFLIYQNDKSSQNGLAISSDSFIKLFFSYLKSYQ